MPATPPRDHDSTPAQNPLDGADFAQATPRESLAHHAALWWGEAGTQAVALANKLPDAQAAELFGVMVAFDRVSESAKLRHEEALWRALEAHAPGLGPLWELLRAHLQGTGPTATRPRPTCARSPRPWGGRGNAVPAGGGDGLRRRAHRYNGLLAAPRLRIIPFDRCLGRSPVVVSPLGTLARLRG
jgi:hypothetical protein